MTRLLTTAVLTLLITAPVVGAADKPKARLGTPGKVLAEPSKAFDQDTTKLPKGWTVQNGKILIADKMLIAHQQKADNHASSFRYIVPVQDAVVRVDFQMDDARMFHIGFDPLRGQLKKKGHLFSVAISANHFSLLYHKDKNDPKSQNATLDTAKVQVTPGKPYTAILEMKGNKVVASLYAFGQAKPLAVVDAEHEEFHVKKPGLVFRVMGNDDQSVAICHIKVQELK